MGLCPRGGGDIHILWLLYPMTSFPEAGHAGHGKPLPEVSFPCVNERGHRMNHDPSICLLIPPSTAVLGQELLSWWVGLGGEGEGEG